MALRMLTTKVFSDVLGGSVRASTSRAMGTVASQVVVAQLAGLFLPKTVHFPKMSVETTQIFQTLHESGKEKTHEWRDLLKFDASSPKEWYDPKFAKPITHIHLQREKELELGGAFRQLTRFNLYFGANTSSQASSESCKAIEVTFGVSESDAKAFYAEVHQLSMQFRQQNGVADFREVIVLVNGISQFTTGPVTKGEELLCAHLDGAQGQKQTTFLYRGEPDSDPLHGLFLTPEGASEPIKAATGFIVFSQIIHGVEATKDAEASETFSVTLGFTVMPLPGEVRIVL